MDMEKTKDNKWIKTRTKQKKEMIEEIKSWEPKAINISFQDTFKSNGLYVTQCFYTINK